LVIAYLPVSIATRSIGSFIFDFAFELFVGGPPIAFVVLQDLDGAEHDCGE